MTSLRQSQPIKVVDSAESIVDSDHLHQTLHQSRWPPAQIAQILSESSPKDAAIPTVSRAEGLGSIASGAPWPLLLAGFQARGVLVRTQHPRCAEPGLEGFYVRGRREVVVCPRGDRSITLRHEGWHLAQSLCLGGRPWLAPEFVARQLGGRDRREVQMLVPPAQWPREAEARVMARLAPGPYFQALDQACAGRLPMQERPIQGSGREPLEAAKS